MLCHIVTSKHTQVEISGTTTIVFKRYAIRFIIEFKFKKIITMTYSMTKVYSKFTIQQSELLPGYFYLFEFYLSNKKM